MTTRRATHTRWPRLAAALIGCALGPLGACHRTEPPADKPSEPPAGSGEAPRTPPAAAGSGGANVTTSGDGWAQARAIADKSGASGLAKWKDDVPYLFQAKGSRGVLVHRGAVVTARGPAALAAYLRDLGVPDGKPGPSPDSLLTLLYVLQAFPTVAGLPEQSAVDTLGPPDLQPRIEQAGGHAKVVLSYRLPADPGPSRGTLPIQRETLDVGPTGDPAWVGERIDWKRP